MMPRALSVVFLLGIGALLLTVAHRGWRNGELPAGSSFFRAYRPNREGSPLAFHFFLALYFCAGIVLCVWGLLAMIGMAPGIEWR